MKKGIVLYALLFALIFSVTACAESAEKPEIRLGVLKGPTGVGAAWLMQDNDLGTTANRYTFAVAGAPDVLMTQLISGELDIAALPSNTVALLSKKTGGEVQALCVNTLGSLFILERGNTVDSLDDLSGKEIFCAGKGTTVEAIVSRLLPPDAVVTYVAEHTEVVAKAAAGQAALVLLPEPFVTALISKDLGYREAINLTDAWDQSGLGVLPMGTFAVRREFAEANPDALQNFLKEFKESAERSVSSPIEVAELAGKYGILTIESAYAEQALLRMNLTCLSGDEMKDALSGYYSILLEGNPALIGGELPGDDFYFVP